MPKTITLETGELPIITKALMKRRRRPLWRRIISALWGKHSYRYCVPAPPPPAPLTPSQIEERSMRGIAKRATQRLESIPQRRTEEIDTSGVVWPSHR